MSTQTVLHRPITAPARWPFPAPDRLKAHAALCAISFLAYIAGRWSGGLTGVLFSAIGAGACGWAWLLARALFDPAPHDARWPRVVAGVVAISGALAVLAPVDGSLSRFALGAYGLSGSAALLLTFVEPFQGRRRPERAETLFRIAFLGVYAVLVAVSILGLEGAEEGRLDDLIKTGCAIVGLTAGGAAVWFRLRRPLARSDRSPSARRAPTAEETRLAARIQTLLRDEAIDAEPDLRIGDLAARLGQPEYKVSQCISTALGFANFNRLINHHRIERAKRLLTESTRDRSVLQVAFDCGFSSIGPFNRAFKEQVGLTPRAFRLERCGRRSDASPKA